VDAPSPSVEAPASADVGAAARNAGAFAALRRFARPRAPRERCDLCAIDLAEQHQHLFSPADRQLHCACDACAILFSGGHGGRYKVVPRQGRYLSDFHMSDMDWEAFSIPINLAFITESTAADRVVAYYPSPAGATESLLPPEAWAQLVADNPRLRELQSDVEALLVNRVGAAREYYLAPIDECYKLVGLIRSNWRGLSGGTEVWRAIAEFFKELKEKSRN
jgi:hypothetical protein